MLKTKLFEIRDRMTFIPCFAFKLDSDNEQERWLLRRAGFAPEMGQVMFGRLDGASVHYDAYQQRSHRTLLQAHLYIEKHFDSLPTGAVIDVEYILGEVETPKVSERVGP